LDETCPTARRDDTMTFLPARASLLCLNLLLLAPIVVLLDRKNERPAETPVSAPKLALQWMRTYPPLKPAWPDQPRLPIDTAYQPVLHGSMVYVASSRNDRVSALDAATGEEKWHFAADGPVRFAPAHWNDRLYFVSDDGHLYCVDAARGRLLWKFRGAPSDRKILGNERLISTWPARGAPTIAEEADGSATVYFAAGIWPFMGIFLYALDANSGAVRWVNDGDGSMYIKQPHQADAFAGVAPQGTLVVVGDKLLVPGGRSVPACYDRHTGRLLHFRLADNSKRGGGPTLLPSPGTAGGNLFVNGPGAFNLDNGDYLGPVREPSVLHEGILYSGTGTHCRAYSLRQAARTVEVFDRKGQRSTRKSWEPVCIGSVATPHIDCLIKAGPRLFAGTSGRVFALELPLRDERKMPSWEAAVDGTPVHLTFQDGWLLVSTREGRIYCFGPEEVTPQQHRFEPKPLPPSSHQCRVRTERILRETGVREGYGVVWGAGSGDLIRELLRQSRLHLVVVEPDPQRVAALRAELIAANVHGERISLLPGTAATVQLPPYLASLIAAENGEQAGGAAGPAFYRTLFAALRPYGGVTWLPLPRDRRQGLNAFLAEQTTSSPPSPPFQGRGEQARDCVTAATPCCCREKVRCRARPTGLTSMPMPPTHASHATGSSRLRSVCCGLADPAIRASCRATGMDRSRRSSRAGCSSRAWTACGPSTSTPAGCSGKRSCPASARRSTPCRTSRGPMRAAAIMSRCPTASTSHMATAAAVSILPTARNSPFSICPPRQVRRRRPCGRTSMLADPTSSAAAIRATSRRAANVPPPPPAST
jgi:outer membrane protein assembly factor BamB